MIKRKRNFLKKMLVYGGAILITPLLVNQAFAQEEENISTNEDLMREHGILRRILLIYREAISHLQKGNLDPILITKSAQIIHDFIENYHEKLEENFLFPRFEKAKKLVDFVAILKTQHQAGRILTQEILQKSKNLQKEKDHLILAMQNFIRMYEPHAAQEDTVLFPAFHNIVSKNEYVELGETFEEQEQKHFGKDGFEKILSEVIQIEKTLQIYNLANFTPHGKAI